MIHMNIGYSLRGKWKYHECVCKLGHNLYDRYVVIMIILIMEMNAKSPNLPIANNTQSKLITVYHSTMYVRSFVFLVY